MKKPILVTGGFDPLHSGHIAYFKAAKALGNYLIVGVNSDAWLSRKKGKPFMSWEERAEIIKNLSCVDQVISFDDSDGSANNAIYKVLQQFPDQRITFANGGDRTPDNIPEYIYRNTPWVTFEFGVGGEDKKNSSSWILKSWSQPTVERAWGRYTVLDKKDGWQVKELAFDAGKALSDQRHFKRSEHWCVVDGEIRIDLEWSDGTKQMCLLSNGESVDIPANTWHKATNVGTITAKVIEVWMGEHLSEEDIERRP
jgi:cytidyltransferase-like protein